MTLDYIYHSGFAIEAEGVTVIIDYYKDSSETEHNRGIVHDYLLQRPGKLYVLATHFHPDHFNREILTWKEAHPDIRYIFSKDILKSHRAKPEDATYIKKGETYEDDTIRIDAFGSTDIGSSFLLHLQDWSIFHAGDLNDWKMEHVGELINGKQERTFRHEIRKLADKPVNFAFVPMDPRLGPYQTLGIDFVLKNTDAEFVFPMHMWQDYSAIREYKKHITNLGMADRVIEIERENQVFPFGEL